MIDAINPIDTRPVMISSRWIELLPRVRKVAHDRQEEPVHEPPGGGRRHPVRAALEQLLMQLFLELRDLHAERRLHDIQTLGRAGDRAVFEQRDEILNLLQVHGCA